MRLRLPNCSTDIKSNQSSRKKGPLIWLPDISQQYCAGRWYVNITPSYTEETGFWALWHQYLILFYVWRKKFKSISIKFDNCSIVLLMINCKLSVVHVTVSILPNKQFNSFQIKDLQWVIHVTVEERRRRNILGKTCTVKDLKKNKTYRFFHRWHQNWLKSKVPSRSSTLIQACVEPRFPFSYSALTP